MDKIKILCETKNSIDYVFNNLSKDELKNILEDYINIKIGCERKIRKYHKSEKGRRKVNEASKRYYYKVKCNNRYHEIYNPLGEK
jgi:hypothetical protein